jgi:hypothetical protein
MISIPIHFIFIFPILTYIEMRVSTKIKTP